MTTNYQWTIQAMDCVPQEDGLTDVVVTAHWNVSATDGTYTSNVYSTQSFTLSQGGTFTPYADLTQEQVVGWVQAAMGAEGVASLEANLNTQIENQINPPIVTPPLPWTPAPTAPAPVV
jgi:hypothetical protein